MKRVRITRIDGGEGGLDMGYWVEGYLARPLAVGLRVILDRKVRNGVVIDGTFTTSPVTAIYDGHFRTENSLYRIEEVPDIDNPT